MPRSARAPPWCSCSPPWSTKDRSWRAGSRADSQPCWNATDSNRSPTRSEPTRARLRRSESGDASTASRGFETKPYLDRMRPEQLLTPTPSGVCCQIGGFHIDPTRPVDKAVITHAHSDHARPGHGAVLATQETLDLMRLRYGERFAGSIQTARLGETLSLGGVSVTFHPAGHVLGSAQVAVAHNGLTVVASGDYKDAADPTCTPFQ